MCTKKENHFSSHKSKMSTNNNQLTMKLPSFYHPEVDLEFAGNAPPFLPVLITQPEVIDNGDVVAIKEEEEDDEEVDNGEVVDCGVDAVVPEVIVIDDTDEEEDVVDEDNGIDHGNDEDEEDEEDDEKRKTKLLNRMGRRSLSTTA